jgi:hypothetical protein
MGEFGEALARYLRLLFIRVFGEWLEPYIGKWLEPYAWHIAAGFLVFSIAWVIVSAVRMRKNRSTTRPEALASTNAASIQHPVPSTMVELGTAYGTLLGSFQNMVRHLEIEAPKSLRIPLIASLVALLCAVVGDWSYDFFVLVRVLIFMTCIVATVAIWKGNRSTSWLWVLVSITVLYDPLLPIHLHKPTWSFVNSVIFIVLGVLCVVLKVAPPAPTALQK